MPKVMALGDVNIDIIAHFDAFPPQGVDAFSESLLFQCGGAAANTARALASMGVETGLIARVGSDPWSSQAVDGLARVGVLLDSLQVDNDVMTGLMFVIVTPDGDRTLIGCRGANARTDPRQIREEEIQSARVLHLSGYALLTEPQREAALLAIEIARRHGLVITLDPGVGVSAAALDAMRACFPAVQILLPNLHEAQRLSGAHAPEICARALMDAGVKSVALKLGAAGCLIGSPEGLFRVPGFAIAARDSTGAGDSFGAGVIAGFLGGLDWRSTAVLGNALGALAASGGGAGAMPPTPPDVLAFLRQQIDLPAYRPWRDAVAQAVAFVHSLGE